MGAVRNWKWMLGPVRAHTLIDRFKFLKGFFILVPNFCLEGM